MDVVGSVAGMMYEHTRSTSDIDVVFEPRGVQPALVAAALAPDYFLDVQMLADSLHSGLIENALGMTGGPKIDFVPLKREPFHETAFARRERVDWHGVLVPVIRPSDLVISKLLWAKESMSERQLADVRAIMSMGLFDEYDQEFQHWIRLLDLAAVLDASRAAGYEA